MTRKKVLMLLGSVCLALVIAVPIAAGCAAPTPTPTAPPRIPQTTPTPSPEITPAPSPSAGEVITWRCASGTSTFTNIAPRNHKIMCEELFLVTGGRLKIDFFLRAETPYTAADMLPAIRNGEYEMVSVMYPNSSGLEAGLGILDLPLLVPDGSFDVEMEVGAQLREGYWKTLYEKWNAKELNSTTFAGVQLWLRDGFLEDWDSLKGLHIRTDGPDESNLIKLMNGTPTSLDAGEVPTSLITGLIDGTMHDVTSGYGYGYPEMCPTMTMTGFNFSYLSILVNQDAWNELPDDLKDIVTNYMESKREWFELGDYAADTTYLAKAFMDYDFKVHSLPHAFREEVRAKCFDAVWKPWLDRAGPEGISAFNEVAQAIIDLGYTVPGYTT